MCGGLVRELLNRHTSLFSRQYPSARPRWGEGAFRHQVCPDESWSNSGHWARCAYRAGEHRRGARLFLCARPRLSSASLRAKGGVRDKFRQCCRRGL